MSIRVTGIDRPAAWLRRWAGIAGIHRSGGGISVRVYSTSMSASIRAIEGDRWRSNEAADLLLELYRDVGLRWLAFTIYTDDDRAHTLSASPDDAPEGWRPVFVTEGR